MCAMQNNLSTRLQRTVALLTGLLIVKVDVAVLLGYVDYFPPNFQSDFLYGREPYFFGGYQWAFYAHLVCGPLSLVWGLLLINRQFRLRFPAWHRSLGRIQVANVLFVVAPSGLWMGYYASTGPIAGVGFAILAVLTGLCVVFGWRSAIQRRFADHRRWMSRCFLLLCSAVVIRVLGGMGTVMGVEAAWFNPLASWASWLVPLAVFELTGLHKRKIARSHRKPVLLWDDHAPARRTSAV
jgi:hypothetical protein